jgi:succinate dehydrogenase/fumarate reductase flavoprotein subunit
MYEAAAKALIQLPSREIAGIRAEVAGKPYFIKASKGVILCCGGFEFDFEMQKQFLPGWPIYGQGSPGNTGDGIRMAQQAGAALWHMNNPLAGLGGIVVPEFAPVVIPINVGGGYIRVDKQGKRFMSENRPSRHGFGQKEYLMFFDGVIGDFTRLPCYTIFDETARAARSAGFVRPQVRLVRLASRVMNGAGTTARKSRRAGSSRARPSPNWPPSWE